jgi:hypothetical protein
MSANFYAADLAWLEDDLLMYELAKAAIQEMKREGCSFEEVLPARICNTAEKRQFRFQVQASVIKLLPFAERLDSRKWIEKFRG